MISLLSDRMLSDNQSELSNNNRNTGQIDLFDASKFKTEADRCILELKTFICILTETIKRFYNIEKRVTSRVAKEQLENFVTSQILAGPVYLLLFNLISMANFEEMQKLEVIVQNSNVNLANL